MEEKGKNYFQERRDGKTTTMVGSPHLRVWVAMLSSIVEATSTKAYSRGVPRPQTGQRLCPADISAIRCTGYGPRLPT
eukprot:12917736-Heterocapsa_arctica.AAC.1